jgi:CheY-like chemotaxis protein
MNHKALLVDDSAIARRILRRVLEERPEVMHTYEAEDGDEAIHMLHKQPADILLLDIDMPGPSGLETIKKIRSLPLEKQPFTVMVSCLCDNLTVLQAMENGADDYVVKPFDRSTLLNKLDKFLQKQKFDKLSKEY